MSKRPMETAVGEEEDFPRGGGGLLTPLERREIREKAEAEVSLIGDGKEIDRKGEKGERKEKRRKIGGAGKENADSESLLTGKLHLGKTRRYAEILKFKNLDIGNRLWGVITEIKPKQLVIGLPNGLRGFVEAQEISDVLTGQYLFQAERNGSQQPKGQDDESRQASELEEGEEDSEDDEAMDELENSKPTLRKLFSKGQLVPCTVLDLTAKNKMDQISKQVHLSLRLSRLHHGMGSEVFHEGMVMTACVQSLEEHGAVLSFGIPSISGFLLFKDYKVPGSDSPPKLQKGQLLQCLVGAFNKDSRTVACKVIPEEIASATVREYEGLTIEGLQPGQLVNCRVKKVLRDGLLVSFLTYFTGTVNRFSLESELPSADWATKYNENTRLHARITVVDLTHKQIRLSLNSELVAGSAPTPLVEIGEVFEKGVIKRVDPGLGLLLQLPTKPRPSGAYVPLLSVAEEPVEKLEKKFKPGQKVRARVIAFRLMDAVAVATMKTSVVDQLIFGVQDVHPGALLKGTVTFVGSFGSIVRLAEGVKALCPVENMSEVKLSKISSKFQVGASLKFRVVSRDLERKKILLTHKKTLINSKLSVITSLEDATLGTLSHGWITGVKDYGIFVSFYNKIKGFAHISELGLGEGVKPQEAFTVGQVVKCRVVPNKKAGHISLSLLKREEAGKIVELGNIVSGTVETVDDQMFNLTLDSAYGSVKAILPFYHLSDYFGHVETLRGLVSPGYKFDRLLVIGIEDKKVVVSTKHSLLAQAAILPRELSQLQTQQVLPGYVVNVTDKGCFVRFLGRLTGLAPIALLSEDFVTDPPKLFQTGQSVRARIIEVDENSDRFILSLKQSSCNSQDATLLEGYFREEEEIARLEVKASGGSLSWADAFKFGGEVTGEIQDVKDYGVIVNLPEYNDVVGFITHYQAGGSVEVGQKVDGRILDVGKVDGVVDISLRKELLDAFAIASAQDQEDKAKGKKKKSKNEASDDQMVIKEESPVALSLLQRVEVVVELVKDDYLVLSLPKYGGIVGYASTRDFNLRTLDPHQHYCPGQRFQATVALMPEEGSGGRLLLLVDVNESPRKDVVKRGKTSFVIGAEVEGKVLAVQPLFMDVKLGKHVRGRLHVSQLPGEHEPGSCPMKDFMVGSTLKARVVGTIHSLPDGNLGKRSGAGHVLMDLSMLMDNTGGTSPDIRPAFQSMEEVEVGQVVTAYIKEVQSDWAHLQLSTHIRGNLFVLDSSSEPSQLSNFSSRFKPGEAVRCQVLFKDLEKQSLRLAMVGSSHEVGAAVKRKVEELTVDGGLSVGKVLGGRIIRVLTDFRGLNIQLGLGLFGRVSIVELRDDWLTNPLEGFKEGQFVRCVVLGFGNSDALGGASKQVNLSLRESLGGCGGEQANALREDKGKGGHEGPHIQRLEDLKTGMEVCGYVKSCTPKGCFVSFAQNMDALVLIKNLSKDYIQEPVKAFPPGKLVNARVVNVDVLSNRVELSLAPLESEKGPNWLREEDVEVGVVVTGTVKRIQPFGAFISIENSNLVGMCHISEVSDDYTKDLRVALSVGQRVRAKVLKVDSGKIALSMKGSVLREAEEKVGVDSEGEEGEEGGEGESESEGEEVEREDDEEGEGEEGEDDEDEGLVAESEELEDEDDEEEEEAKTSDEGNGQGKRKREKEGEGGVSVKKVPAVIPLEVNLDGSLEKSEDKNEEEEGEGVGGDEGEDPQKMSKRAKKRNKEEREAAIRLAEERRVAGEAAPSTMEDYERLSLSSPSSSYVWIKYMAFLLSLTEVEKARAVAERALSTIPYREEGEKMNVWVAYLALENMHGDPPKEAVLKLFQRALQYCDPKKLHLALLGLYERTEQHSLADELFRSMTRKFGTSAKIWLRNIQNLLNRGLHEAARKVLDRSLLSLPKRKHIKVISRSALLEFKIGTPERARAMFDGILRNYPKRIDLWSTYIDQEIRLKDHDVIRRLFERAISLDLPAKKMKSLFKKYLDYEKEYGDDETVEQVKAKAMAYVEGRVGS